MNFVDKQHVALVQIGQQGREIPRPFQGGAGGDAEIDPHLRRNNGRQGGFAQAGRAVQQHVIQGLATNLGRVDKDRQVILDLFLADVFGQGAGTQRVVAVVLGQVFGGYHAVFVIHFHGRRPFLPAAKTSGSAFL